MEMPVCKNITEFTNLQNFLDHGWSGIIRGVADAKSPARHPTLATVSETNAPEIRTVVLRKANQKNSTVQIHTDKTSKKVRDLSTNSNGALHIWLPKSRLQIRLNIIAKIQTGSDVKDLWDKVPERSRISYGTVPAPGTPIETPLAYQQPSNSERFAVLKCQVIKIELLHLGLHHIRAQFSASSDWKGTWLAP